MSIYLLLIFAGVSIIGIYFSVNSSLINSSDLLNVSDEKEIPTITIKNTWMAKIFTIPRFRKKIPILYFVLLVYSKILSLFVLIFSSVLIFFTEYEVIALIDLSILFSNQLIILFSYSVYKKVVINW